MLDLDPAEADVDSWRGLAARAVEPNVFFEPELLLPAIRELEGSEVRLLVTQDAGGEWTGALPVRRVGHWRRAPVLALGTWRHRHCFFGAPLLAAGAQEAALDELVATMRSRSSLVALEYLPAEGPVAEATQRVLAAAGIQPVVWRAWERAALRRRAQDDYVESTLAPKRRRELRRQRGQLERMVGGPVECVDAARDPDAVEAYLALESGGWKGRQGTALEAAFFRQTCAALRAADRLELLLLRAGDRVVAGKCNFISGEGVYCFKIAHDEALRAYSPGVQLELENVHTFHRRARSAWQDSCADPANQMINRLWPDRRRLTTLLVPGTGMRGRVGRVQAELALHVRGAQRGRSNGRRGLLEQAQIPADATEGQRITTS